MPTALGAGAGAALLLTPPARIFEAVVPFLIAGSSLLLLGQPWIVARAAGGMVGARLARRVPAPRLRVGIAVVGLVVAGWTAVAGA